MPSGSQLVSRMATIGIPSRRASRIAIDSRFVSITNTMSGTPPIDLMPPRLRSSFSRSRSRLSRSFLVRPCASPCDMSSSWLRRRIDWEMVFQLVSMPPSQRALT